MCVSRRTVFLLATVTVLSFCRVQADSIRFIDITAASGVGFVHVNGMQGELWLAEILGAGVGVLDFDDDGWMDLWFVQGGPLFDRQGTLPKDQLYRNVTTSDGIRFEPVSNAELLSTTHYGMGIATGDVDRDGDTDVFLANFGTNQLFENLGSGQFREVGEEYGLTGSAWSIAGSFADYDKDGHLDLYVVNYVDFSLQKHKTCLGISPGPDYCAPTAYASVNDQIYRNLEGKRFEDASEVAGIREQAEGGLGVISADLNGDGWLDVYVANDPGVNFLWQNVSGFRFDEIGMGAGAAVNGDGKTEASMGLDVADPDHDCDPDLFVTNLTAETNTFLANSGKGWFIDRTNSVGLGATSYPYTGFGTGWVDFDLDGDLDVLVANGAVSLQVNRQIESDLPLAQRNQLWVHTASEKYLELTDDDITRSTRVSRGVAFGDFDNDGDQDIVVTNNNGPAQLFENVSTDTQPWLGLTVLKQGTLAMSAKVSIKTGECVAQTVRTDGSYASANDPRVVFGLKSGNLPQTVSVTFLDGSTVEYGPLDVNRYHVLTDD